MNYSAKIITEIYKKEISEKNNIFNIFKGSNLNVTFAFGGIYIKIDEVFTDIDTGFKNDKNGYGGLSFLGNIKGKTERQLFFKNKELKNIIDSYRGKIDYLNEEISEAISEVVKQHGKPIPEYSILMYRLKN